MVASQPRPVALVSAESEHVEASKSNETDSSATKANESPSETVPTSANTIPEIKAYLDKHHISYSSSANKDALLALIPSTEK